MNRREQLVRRDLKHNFLKTIIVRFDFNGLAEIELDEWIKDIKPLLHKRGYNRLTMELATEMDFQMDDPEIMEMEGIPVGDVRRQRVYVFKNHVEGINLKISPVFAAVLIEETKYIDFFEYGRTLLEVMALIRRKTEFFSPVRFGLRKINQCVLKDINLLNRYFETEYYRLSRFPVGSTTKLFQAKDCMMYEQYHINFLRTVILGEMDDSDAYQVVLDSDIYLLDPDEVEKLIDDGKLLEPMNRILFELYKSVITEGFIEQLCQDMFEDTNIIGVEKNE